MNQTRENGEKPNYGPNFGPYNFFCEGYLCQQLDIAPSYHPMQFKGKLMNQT